jgi:hypothetical protein
MPDVINFEILVTGGVTGIDTIAGSMDKTGR